MGNAEIAAIVAQTIYDTGLKQVESFSLRDVTMPNFTTIYYFNFQSNISFFSNFSQHVIVILFKKMYI